MRRKDPCGIPRDLSPAWIKGQNRQVQVILGRKNAQKIVAKGQILGHTGIGKNKFGAKGATRPIFGRNKAQNLKRIVTHPSCSK